MKPKVELVEVEDESIYTKTDWTAVFAAFAINAAIVMFFIHIFL